MSLKIGLSISTLLIVIRTVYRMVATAEGLSSALAQNEILFLVLDGALVFIAITLLLATFPGRMLGPSWPDNTIQSRRMTQKSINRPAPIQLQRSSYEPYYNRVSAKSNITSSPNMYTSNANSPKTHSPKNYSPKNYSPKHYPPKTSPRRANLPPATQRNMVDREQLW
jgi:hypothetical protein